MKPVEQTWTLHLRTSIEIWRVLDVAFCPSVGMPLCYEPYRFLVVLKSHMSAAASRFYPLELIIPAAIVLSVAEAHGSVPLGAS